MGQPGARAHGDGAGSPMVAPPPPPVRDVLGRDAARASARAFEMVCRAGPLSRAKLRRNLGISLSTVTAAAQELIERGLVVEAGHASSTGGRPPVLLDVAPTLGGVLAVDIGGINVRVAAADCRGTIL